MTRAWAVPVFLLALGGAAFGDADDPPARVARLNYMSGTVSFRPGSVEEWGAATMNYPLTTGDHLWTDDQGGAEMHVGSAALRLAGSTAGPSMPATCPGASVPGNTPAVPRAVRS